jgi:hypothetical protein
MNRAGEDAGHRGRQRGGRSMSEELYRVIHEALSFYATEWEDTSEFIPTGPHGSGIGESLVGDLEPSNALREDRGDRAMAALSHLMKATS